MVQAEWVIFDDESVERIMDGWRLFFPAGEKVWNQAKEAEDEEASPSWGLEAADTTKRSDAEALLRKYTPR